MSLLCDSIIQFAGINVSGNLKYIGKDFSILSMKMVDQKMRKNVKNLGMYARLHDVVTNVTVSLEKLAELTLNVAIDKTLQTSS